MRWLELGHYGYEQIEGLHLVALNHEFVWGKKFVWDKKKTINLLPLK